MPCWRPRDRAGQAVPKANGYGGYTSCLSLNDLPRRATVFALLKRRLDRHAGLAAQRFDLILGPGDWSWTLACGSAPTSARREGRLVTSTRSVLSSVIYVNAPRSAGALRLEIPRLPSMITSPPGHAAPESSRTFVTIAPTDGALLVWESWLRHEVLPGAGRAPRVSISFNYAWR